MTTAATIEGGQARRWVGRVLLLGVMAVAGAYAAKDAITLGIFASYAVVGTILVVRRPRNLIGWILVGIGIAFTGTTPPASLDTQALVAGTASWGEFLAAWLSGWSGTVGYALYVALSQLFPTGRLPDGPAWRRLATALLVSASGILALTAFGPAIALNTGGPTSLALPNRFDLLGWLPIFHGVPPDLFFAPMLVLLPAGVASMVIRYRRATGVIHLQLRWLVASVAFVAVALLFGLASLAVFGAEIGLLAWLPALVAYLSVPAAVAAAVLRYRLYDIDRIISRTISWAMVTGFLVGLFAAGVLLLQTVLAGIIQGQTLAVAVSTLAAFALFQPLRRRIQAAVDRRFDRARYDAQRTADGFAERVRNEVDLGALRTDLIAVAMDAVRPGGAGVWLRRGDSVVTRG